MRRPQAAENGGTWRVFTVISRLAACTVQRNSLINIMLEPANEILRISFTLFMRIERYMQLMYLSRTRRG